ncbi:hypothetical protein GI482_00360 [Bacillus sp. N3536]|nr:hypothetical protein GI482_00360 [Bacillus sp. N3536]
MKKSVLNDKNNVEEGAHDFDNSIDSDSIIENQELVSPSPIQDVIDRANEMQQLIKSPIEELSKQLRETFSFIPNINRELTSLVNLIPQIDFLKLEIDLDITSFEALIYYEEVFKQIGVAVDENFLVYLKINESDLSLSSDVQISNERLESILLNYFRKSMGEESLAFEYESNHKSFNIFKESMLQSIKSKNWIASSMMLHTYVDKLTQELFKEFKKDDCNRLETYAKEKPRSLYFKKNRQALMSALTDLDDYQMNASISEAKQLLPLAYLQIACSIYDSLPSRVNRNSVVHFNENVDFTLVDELYVYKLIQIVKLIEQQLPISKDYILKTLELLHQAEEVV